MNYNCSNNIPLLLFQLPSAGSWSRSEPTNLTQNFYICIFWLSLDPWYPHGRPASGSGQSLACFSKHKTHFAESVRSSNFLCIIGNEESNRVCHNFHSPRVDHYFGFLGWKVNVVNDTISIKYHQIDKN